MTKAKQDKSKAPEPPVGHPQMATDRPILNPAQDRLELSSFVERLKVALMDLPAEESLVVGLYGAWGQGKSSILNLLEHQLQHGEPSGSAIVIRFNAWLYDNTSALLASFLGSLRKRIVKHADMSAEKKEKLSTSLEGLADFVEPLTTMLSIVNPVAGVAGKMLSGAAKLLKADKPDEDDFVADKAVVSEALLAMGAAKKPQRLIILIDDLDRANSPELRAILKLVRLIADLPNTTYVLAMDEARVREILAADTTESFGTDFLDKIVQVGIHIPPISETRLRETVIGDLRDCLKQSGLNSTFLDSETNPFPYDQTLGARIHTLRDRARFLNTVRFTLLAGRKRLDLNGRDLVLLAFLQTFFPDIYARVRRNRDFLTGADIDHMMLAIDRSSRAQLLSARAERLKRLANTAPSGGQQSGGADPERALREQEAVTQVLKILFPNAENGSVLGDDDALRARLENRICVPEIFDRYFRLEPNDDEVADDSAIEFVELLAHQVEGLSEPVRLVEVRARVDLFTSRSQAQADSFSGKVADRLSVISTDVAMTVVQTLLDVQDAFDARVVFIFFQRIVQAVLREAARSGEDGAKGETIARDILVEAARRVADDEAALALVEQHIRKPQGAYVLSEESRRPVAEAGLARIRSFFAKTPDLFSAVSGFAAIEWLWNWRRLLATVEADHLEVAVYLKKLLEARPSALSQVLSIAAGWSGEQPSYEHVAQKDVIDMFARLGMLDDVSKRARAVSNTDADVGPYPYLVNAFLQRLGPPGSSGL